MFGAANTPTSSFSLSCAAKMQLQPFKIGWCFWVMHSPHFKLRCVIFFASSRSSIYASTVKASRISNMIATSKSWIWSPKKDSLFCKDTWRTGDMCQWFLVTLQEFILRVKDGLEVCLCEVRQYLCMYYIYKYDMYVHMIHRFSLFDFSVNQEQFQKKYQLRRFLYLGVWNGLAATPGDSSFIGRSWVAHHLRLWKFVWANFQKRKTTPCFQQTAGDVSIGWFFLVVVVGERISVQLYRSHRI